MKKIFLLSALFAATSATAQVQRWEYLTFISRDDFNSPQITIFEAGKYNVYKFSEFQEMIKKSGRRYEYENDYLDYFGSLGWELTGVEAVPSERPYGPQHIFYFKRPIKK